MEGTMSIGHPAHFSSGLCCGIPSVEQNRPALDADRGEQPGRRPHVFGEPRAHLLLGAGLDDLDHLAVTLEGSAEDDEAVLHQLIHVARVLLPVGLLAHTARPVPGAATREPDDEMRHAGSLAGCRLHTSVLFATLLVGLNEIDATPAAVLAAAAAWLTM